MATRKTICSRTPRKYNAKKPGKRVKRMIEKTDSSANEALRAIELFSSLSDDELRQVREKMVIKKFKKNEVILHEENTSEYMYIILEGEAKVIQVTGEGKGIIVTMHRTGDFFGELSLIDGKTAPATVKASCDSITAIISKKDFYSLIHSQ